MISTDFAAAARPIFFDELLTPVDCDVWRDLAHVALAQLHAARVEAGRVQQQIYDMRDAHRQRSAA